MYLDCFYEFLYSDVDFVEKDTPLKMILNNQAALLMHNWLYFYIQELC